MEVSPLTVRREDAQATGEVSIDLSSRTLGGALHAAAPDLRAWQGSVPDAWQVGGRLDADTTLQGTLDEPVIITSVSSPSLEFAGDIYTGLAGSVTLKDRALWLPRLVVHKDEGELAISGRFGLDRSYDAELEATGLTWGRTLVGDVETRLSVEGKFSGAGTFDRPQLLSGDESASYPVVARVDRDILVAWTSRSSSAKSAAEPSIIRIRRIR